MEPLINGTSYDWSQISLGIMGAFPAGIKAIKYGSKREKVNNYGIGSQPISRGRGPISYEGSITMEMADVVSLQKVAPNGDITLLPPFPITCSWIPDGGKILTETLRYVEFTENVRDVKQGDMTVDVALPLIIGVIDFQK